MPVLFKKDYFIILQIVSNMLRMLGLVLLIPVLVALAYGDFLYALVFFIMAGVLFFGFTYVRQFLHFGECRTKHAIISLALGWFAVSLVSSVPFLIQGMGLVDAFFESMSGWTGTGLTMIPDPATLSAGLNFFRGFIQWVGGIGIVVLVLLLYEKPKTAYSLFLAEGRFEDFYLDFMKIARVIAFIYLMYTIAGIIALVLVGVPLIDAMVHCMTSISTGGYSSNAIGIGVYGPWAMLIGIVLMLIGSISFVSHFHLIEGRPKKFLKNPEIRFLFFMLLIFSGLVLLDLSIASKGEWYHGVFYLVSAVSGTGAGTPVLVDYFPPLTVFLIILLMIFGATYGSTTGALKIWRIMILFKLVKREIAKAVYPEGTMMHVRMGNNIIDNEDAVKVASYFFLYLLLLIVGSMTFILVGYSTLHSFFIVSSAQGNVGLNIIATDYYTMPWLLKLQLTFHMLLGRMEIIPFLIMVRSVLPSRRY